MSEINFYVNEKKVSIIKNDKNLENIKTISIKEGSFLKLSETNETIFVSPQIVLPPGNFYTKEKVNEKIKIIENEGELRVEGKERIVKREIKNVVKEFSMLSELKEVGRGVYCFPKTMKKNMPLDCLMGIQNLKTNKLDFYRFRFKIE